MLPTLDAETVKVIANGGSAFLLFLVICALLWSAYKFSGVLTQIAEKFSAHMAESQKGFQDQLGQIHAESREVVKDVVRTVDSLNDNVRDMNNSLLRIQSQLFPTSR